MLGWCSWTKAPDGNNNTSPVSIPPPPFSFLFLLIPFVSGCSHHITSHPPLFQITADRHGIPPISCLFPGCTCDLLKASATVLSSGRLAPARRRDFCPTNQPPTTPTADHQSSTVSNTRISKAQHSRQAQQEHPHNIAYQFVRPSIHPSCLTTDSSRSNSDLNYAVHQL